MPVQALKTFASAPRSWLLPALLALAVGRLGAKHPMYIGDTPDDLLTVRRYNERFGPMLSCMVTVALETGSPLPSKTCMTTAPP